MITLVHADGRHRGNDLQSEFLLEVRKNSGHLSGATAVESISKTAGNHLRNVPGSLTTHRCNLSQGTGEP